MSGGKIEQMKHVTEDKQNES